MQRLLFLTLFIGVFSCSEKASESASATSVSTEQKLEKDSIPLSPGDPIIKHMYTADPSARVINDTLFIYPSHDQDTATRFSMEDWHVFSTVDLENFTDHGEALSLDDISWAEQDAWAPDCIERNGKYYFYYPTDQKHIGVAVGDKPTGPFADPLGHPLISHNSPGVYNKRDFIDPGAFIDDDGQAYLVMGQQKPNLIKLNEDMISYDGEVHILEGVDGFFEAAWLHKRNGLYYLSYCGYVKGEKGTRIMYAVAENILGPYETKGEIIGPVNSGTNHHSIVEWKGKSYLFYHNANLYFQNNPDVERAFGWSKKGTVHGYRRSITFTELEYNDDNTIKQIF